MLKISKLICFALIIFSLGCSRDEAQHQDASNCKKVTDVSFQAFSTSINLYYGNGSNANSYKIEYGLSGFPQGSGKSIVTSNTQIQIEDLNPSTTYDFYITGICSSTESSAPFKLASVTTDQSKCSGDTTLDFYQYNNTEITLAFSYSGGSAYKYDVEYGPEGFTLGTGTKQSTSAYGNMITVQNLPNGKKYDFYAKTYCSQQDSNGYKKFSYTTGPTCPKPFNLYSYVISGACNVGMGATRGFSWSSYGSPQSYTISLVQDPNNPPGAQVFTTSNTSIAISNMYCNWKAFYVRSNCGNGQTSDWAGPFVF